MIIYLLVFGFLTNCYVLTSQSGWIFAVSVIAFLMFNAVCGIFLCSSKIKRLKFLYHGTTLLTSFCVSVVISVALSILMLANIIPCTKDQMIGNIIYCIITELILFWNGIICVYLTSVQLGIKTRMIGILCGPIPILHLFALRKIIRTSYKEVRFETEKEQLNDKRRSDTVCKTKYPILFVHGVFFRDFKHLNYWGRIPDELTKNGAVCYYGEHESASSVKDSGEELALRIKEITEQTCCGKVNIIAHSKGGLDCRYALKYCGAEPYVASLTTINTPHRGCMFSEWLIKKAPNSLKYSVAATYNRFAKVLGDKSPDFLAAVNDLSTEFCTDFDKKTGLPENVLCRSVGSVMKNATSGKFPLNLSHNFVKLFDGDNDGLVGAESFEWGNEYIFLNTPLKRGISHGDMIDLNRENIDGFDVREFYVDLVKELKNKGL